MRKTTDLYVMSRSRRNVVMFPLSLYYMAAWLDRDNDTFINVGLA